MISASGTEGVLPSNEKVFADTLQYGTYRASGSFWVAKIMRAGDRPRRPFATLGGGYAPLAARNPRKQQAPHVRIGGDSRGGGPAPL